MPTRLRKSRRFRGSRHCGWGQVGQHRKSGGRGGRGKAGLMKHKWTWTVKYAPDHFGKSKFAPPRRNIAKSWINVGHLDALYEKIRRQTKGRRRRKPIIDLLQLGFDKLLGEGEVKGAYKIIVARFTRTAQEKVEKAGGEIVMVK